MRTILARITRRQPAPAQPAKQAGTEQATALPGWIADALARGEGGTLTLGAPTTAPIERAR